MRILPILGISLLMMGCGGRVANPVKAQNDHDKLLTCSHLNGEKTNLDKRLIELVGETKDKGPNNLGMLMVSPLFLDLSQTEKEEAKAIDDRKIVLAKLMDDKDCKVINPDSVETDG